MNDAEHEIRKTPQPAERTAAASDCELLNRFAQSRDEAAFAVIVSRYSGMVLGVCGRVLGNSQDAEDAFQASFLVLARDARKIRKQRSLASWLYGVAYRTALRARKQRFRQREESLREDVMGHSNPLAELADRQEREAVDEELNQLPTKYRQPLVLHYLMGRNSRQIADELQLSISATEGRLRRGREKLRDRLARRGIGMAAVLAAIHAVQSTCTAAVSPTLISSTVAAGVAFSGSGRSGATVSEEAARLAGKEIGTMSLSTTATATMTAAAVVALAIGISSHSSVSNEALGSGPLTLQTATEAARRDSKPGPRIGLAGRVPAEPVVLNAAGNPGNRLPANFEANVEKQIRNALSEQTNFEFVDLPLKDALQIFSKQHSVNIVLDALALRKHNLDPATPVSMKGNGITLGSALNLVLRPLNLRYVVRDEVVVVTSGAKGIQNLKSDAVISVVDSGPSSAVSDFRNRSQLVMKIEEALSKPTEEILISATLEAAAGSLAEAHGITIIFDPKAVQEGAIALDSKVDLTFKGAKLSSALGLILEPLDLDYVIKNEVLLITTKINAEQYMESRVYNLGGLSKPNPDALAELIQSSIRPDSWRRAGAAANKNAETRKANIVILNGTLVITQSQRAHNEICDLLEQLARAAKAGNGATARR